MRVSRPTKYLEVSGTIKKETANAVLLKFENDKAFENREVWWPLSQIGSMHHENDKDRIKVSEWIYNRKLEEFGIEAPAPETRSSSTPRRQGDIDDIDDDEFF